MGIVADLVDATFDAVSDVLEAAGDAVEWVGEVVVDTIEYVVENPVEAIITIGAASVGIPPPVTAAAITAAKGGDLEDIGKAALGAYASQYVGSTVGSAVAQQTQGSALQNVLSNAAASGSAAATRAAIQGGDVGESFLRGATGGAVASAARDVATAADLGTTPFSEQTRMLAAQGVGVDPIADLAAQAGGATGRAAVSGDFGAELQQELLTAGTQAAANQLRQIYQAATTPQQQAGAEPVMVAGGADGIGSMAAQPLLGERLIDSRSFDISGEPYTEHVYQGQNSDGRNYRYSIIVGPDGLVAYRYRNEANEDVVVDAEVQPEIRDQIRAGGVGITDPITGELFQSQGLRINIYGVGDEGEGPAGEEVTQPISSFLDLRQFGSDEGGRGRAVFGGGGYAAEGTDVPFSFFGVDSNGNHVFDIGGDPFTLITLPNKERVLASNVTDVVLYPTVDENKDLKLTSIKADDVVKAVPAPKDRGAAGGGGLVGGLTSDEIDRLISEELDRIDEELRRVDEQEKQRVEQLEQTTTQRERLSRLPERARLSPEVSEMVDAEIALFQDQRERLGRERQAIGARREQITQAMEGGITDEEIMNVLGGGGDGTGLPDLSGVGTGRGEEGEGRGTAGEGGGPGAGEEGTGEGGEGEFEVGVSDAAIPVAPDFQPSTVGLPRRPLSLSPRQVGQGVGSITGRKEPVFGGDPGAQQDVWNIRSLRLKRALGL
jgi:hypothetical protein